MPTEKTENFFASWLCAWLSGLTLVWLNVFTGPTPVVVQYMYNTCTIFVQLVNVHILYKYCTYIVPSQPRRMCNGNMMKIVCKKWMRVKIFLYICIVNADLHRLGIFV